MIEKTIRRKYFLNRNVCFYQKRRAKININVTNKVEMSEALDTVAGELLEQIASS